MPSTIDTTASGVTVTGSNTAGLNLSVSGTTRLAIDSSGNVGIGTTSPNAKLDVGGTIWSRPGVSTGAVAILTADATSGANGISLSSSFATGGYGPIIFNTSNTERMRIDSSGNVGIGTTSPGTYGNAYTTVNAIKISDQVTTIGAYYQAGVAQYGFINVSDAAGTTAQPLIFSNGSNTERMRIDTYGGLRVGTTTNIFNAASSEKFSAKNTSTGCAASFEATNITGGYPVIYVSSTDAVNTGTQNTIIFLRSGSIVGSITTTASATAYNTSSDYRLKENVQPMTGALDKVTRLKPCTYTWKANGEAGEGFIAHELAEVCPSAVTGEKDAVKEDGTIIPQGIDTSFLVATLVAAIQELTAKVEALEAK